MSIAARVAESHSRVENMKRDFIESTGKNPFAEEDKKNAEFDRKKKETIKKKMYEKMDKMKTKAILSAPVTTTAPVTAPLVAFNLGNPPAGGGGFSTGASLNPGFGFGAAANLGSTQTKPKKGSKTK